MARPARRDGKISVTLHVDKAHRYASTQPSVIDPVSGRKKYSRVHWGYVTEDLVFLPNFKLKNSPEVWDTLDFPPEWDISRMEELRSVHEHGKKMVYVDLSHCIADGDPPYPGDPPTVITQWSTLEKEHFRLKQVILGSHSGTHMDSPSHLLPEGRSLDSFAPSSFFHEAFVLDVRDVPSIGKERVSAIPPDVSSVLFFTGWQDRWNSERYFEDPPLLTEEAATLLLERGVRLFGFDSASCDSPRSESLPIHHLIFSYDGLILENLTNLDKVAGCRLSLVALPLLLDDSDGSPTRVIASYRA